MSFACNQTCLRVRLGVRYARMLLALIAALPGRSGTPPAELTVRVLKSGIGGNHGLLDVHNLKARLLAHLLWVDLDSRKVDTRMKTRIRDTLGSHAAYRNHIAPFDDDAHTDAYLTWKSGLTEWQRRLCSLYEAGVMRKHE